MIKNKFKIISAVLAAATVLSAAVSLVSAADISPTRSYNGQFSDVSSSAWYYDSVSGAYSLGLISGVDDTHFSPDGTITIAQAVKLAASCHQLLTDGKTTELRETKTGTTDTYPTPRKTVSSPRNTTATLLRQHAVRLRFCSRAPLSLPARSLRR